MIGRLLIGVAVVLLVAWIGFDLVHQDSYRLVCRDREVQLQRGRRLPLPFGYRPLGGVYGPLPFLVEATCDDEAFDNQERAEAAYLDFLLTQVRRALARPEGKTLPEIRRQLIRALQITRTTAHRARRRETRDMMADLSYLEARATLARTETEIRTALAHLKEARELAGSRYDDLDEWINHLEVLVEGLAPMPRVNRPPAVLPFSGGDLSGPQLQAPSQRSTPRVDAGSDASPQGQPNPGVLM